jgi:hypothetical protein
MAEIIYVKENLGAIARTISKASNTKFKKSRRSIGQSLVFKSLTARLLQKTHKEITPFTWGGILARDLDPTNINLASTKKDVQANIDNAHCVNFNLPRAQKFIGSCKRKYKQYIGEDNCKFSYPENTSDLKYYLRPTIVFYDKDKIEYLLETGLAKPHEELQHMNVKRVKKLDKYIELHVLDRKNLPEPKVIVTTNDSKFPTHIENILQKRYESTKIVCIVSDESNPQLDLGTTSKKEGNAPTSGEEVTNYATYLICVALLSLKEKINL